MTTEPFSATWMQPREERTDRVVLTANTDHWNRERGPRLERVVYVNDISNEAALEAVCDREGEIDIVGDVAPTDAQRVIDSEHAQLVAIDAMRVVIAMINRRDESAPMQDVRVRTALNLAVDRDDFVAKQLLGYGTPLVGMTPPWAKGYPDMPAWTYDPERARALLAEAGWPTGRALRIAAAPDQVPHAQYLATQYRKALGIEVELVLPSAEQVPGAERAIVEKVMDLGWDIQLFSWFDLTADVPPAVMHREFFHTVGAFRTGDPVADFDDLFATYMTTTDPKELDRLGAELDQVARDQSLAVFLASPQALYAVNEHVDFVAYRATFELAETEVSDQHWSRR